MLHESEITSSLKSLKLWQKKNTIADWVNSHDSLPLKNIFESKIRNARYDDTFLRLFSFCKLVLLLVTHVLTVIEIHRNKEHKRNITPQKI